MLRDDDTVTIIIPTHNRGENLVKALNSIFNSEYSKDSIEVIIVGSIPRRVLKEIKQLINTNHIEVKIINTKNSIYPSIARTLGYLKSKGKFILAMDDDCLLDKTTIYELVKVIKLDDNIGGLGPAVRRHSNGKIQYSGALITPIFTPLKIENSSKQLHYVEFIPGTITMFSRKALEKCGLWDYINFPWHAEDADLCTRLRKKGFKVAVVPYVKAYHLKDALIDVSSLQRAYYSGRSRIVFYRKYFGKFKFIIYFCTINIAIVIFYIIYLLFRKVSLKLLREYIKGVAHGLVFKIKRYYK